jgi:hypothetical protein
MSLPEDLLSTIQALPEDEKLKILKLILLEFVEAHPNQEIAVFDDPQDIRVWCVPKALYRPYIPPEMLAEMKRRVANRGPFLSWQDLRTKLEKTAEDKGDTAPTTTNRDVP